MIRKHPLAECENCDLYHNKQAAYAGGCGPSEASVVILGEAPGYQEAKSGTPFVGPSGMLLDKVLDHHGLDRGSMYVDNVVACRPPGNDTPSKSAIKACWPRARSEMASRSPGTILTLGNTATQTVLDTTDGITSVRVGRPKQSDQFPGARVIPTFHPAACLRNGDSFPFLVADIGKVNRTDEAPWTEPDFRVFDEPDEAVRAIGQLHESDYVHIVVDIECGIEKDTEFDHPEHYQMLCIGFAYAPNKAIVIGENALQDISVKYALQDLFADPTKEWIAHNAKFDKAGLLGGEFATSMRIGFDTILASYALDERRGTNSLEYNSVELLGSPDWKFMIERYLDKSRNYANIPRDVLYKYNAFDDCETYKLFEYYDTELEAAYEPTFKTADFQGPVSLRNVHDLLVSFEDSLMHCEMSGLGVDIDVLDELTETYLGSLESMEQDLKPWVKNPRSPKQVKEALHDMGIRVPNTEADTLRRIWERIDTSTDTWKFLDLMLAHRKEAKLYGTYVKGIRSRLRKGRVHTSFLIHGTTTGRLSSRNPNLQNIPRGSTIRRMFVPAPGNVFVQCDYDQIELRIAAAMSEDPYLVGVFSDPTRDIFDEMGLVLYGDMAAAKANRFRTKAYVYGVGYGREAHSIAVEFRVSPKDAQKGMDAWLANVPVYVEWREELMNCALTSQDDLITPFGRHRRYWLITNDNRNDVRKEGLAFIPQSTASDVNLCALAELHRMGYEVRVPVHDSILLECPEDAAEAVAVKVQQVMEETATYLLGDRVPLTCEAKIGKNWGDV